MTDFASQVWEALEGMPHQPDCAREIGCPFLHCPHGRGAHACSCDRPRRQAERVAKALREMVPWDYGIGNAVEYMAALSALKGEI